VLCCAVLRCAVLCCAVLCCAVLCCAVLCCAVLCCAVLCCAHTPTHTHSYSDSYSYPCLCWCWRRYLCWCYCYFSSFLVLIVLFHQYLLLIVYSDIHVMDCAQLLASLPPSLADRGLGEISQVRLKREEMILLWFIMLFMWKYKICIVCH
jgi:hypothetical protein